MWKNMKKNKIAFTLVEVVVATSILMISVFGVYKLIWENSRLINNNDNYLQLHSLFPALESCIDKIWYNGFPHNFPLDIPSPKKYDFWPNMNWCSNSISSSWKVVLDNIEYSLSSKVLSWWIDFIDFELEISWDWIGAYTGSYRLVK